ncbi:hypothetical protein [Bradyrhizobium canariense]|uniref:hypothetical protein n=1 Tax=Bradyrhizobium canariense TaxID=255045 RepID=UPI003F7BB71E
MVEEGVADEVVLRLVISADEHDGESPAILRSISVCRSASALIREIAGDVISPQKVTMKSKLSLLWKILDANLDRLLLIVKIPAAMKVMLVDHRPAIQPLGPQHEVESLANRRFPDVVAADQESVPRQMHDTVGNAAEVRDCKTLCFHLLQPPGASVGPLALGNLPGKAPSKPYPPSSNPPLVAAGRAGERS